MADRKQPPRCYFYVFAVLAFFGWALGTSSVWNLLSFPEIANKIAILITAFLVPLLDGLAEMVMPEWSKRQCPRPQS
jgi:hypothetical protein